MGMCGATTFDETIIRFLRMLCTVTPNALCNLPPLRLFAQCASSEDHHQVECKYCLYTRGGVRRSVIEPWESSFRLSPIIHLELHHGGPAPQFQRPLGVIRGIDTRNSDERKKATVAVLVATIYICNPDSDP